MFLIVAGRATREAEQILGGEGGSVRFDSRDIASLATTCLIQSFREGWIGSAQKVAEAKIEWLRREAQAGASAKPAAAADEFKPAAQAWSTRGEKKAVFARLREIVGEVDYAKELDRAGVQSAAEFRYLNEARACYERLVALAKKEAA